VLKVLKVLLGIDAVARGTINVVECQD
jgi:hypothetical protein